jgi:nuclease S1
VRSDGLGQVVPRAWAARGRRLLAAVLVLGSAVGLRPAPAAAWGAVGHALIARVAAAYVTPEARTQVRELLHGASLADVASWADDIRERREETARWHFVDIPLWRRAYDPHWDCRKTPRGDCAVRAIGRFERTLADPQAPPATRAEALKFLVHLIGDIHQPLHCATNHDGGGNDVPVTFFGEPTNLHWVWDTGIIEHVGLRESAYLGVLDAWLQSEKVAALQRGSVVEWVNESHRLAVEHAYKIPADHRLGDAYFVANRPIVDRQLATAGVRLARVLNDALGR